MQHRCDILGCADNILQYFTIFYNILQCFEPLFTFHIDLARHACARLIMHVCMILSSLPKCTNILFQDDTQDATRLLILDAFRDVIRSACPRLPGHVQYVVNHVVVLALDVTSQHYANSNFTRDVSWILRDCRPK